MIYNKPPLSFKEQADQLISRGLIADRSSLVSTLTHVNYYRLSTYLYPFRNGKENFYEGATLEKVWNLYTFDRQLRLLLWDGIERFEISIKTNIANYFTCNRKTPFPHTHYDNYNKNCNSKKIETLLKHIRDYADRSNEPFIEHFENKYNEEKDLPLWIAIEVMTFGNIFTLYSCLNKHDQAVIAKQYSIQPRILHSWLQSLNYVRNLCAHHSRTWNRRLAVFPMIPRKDKRWLDLYYMRDNQRKIYSIFTILKFLIGQIAPKSKWTDRFLNLIREYPQIDLGVMGFPKDWEQTSIWELKE